LNVFSIFFTAFIIIAIIVIPYKRYIKILKYLTLSLLTYIVTALIVGGNWYQILISTIVPHIEFTADFATMLVAILGTTISPYLFFWQASEEAEEEVANHKIKEIGKGKPEVSKKEIKSKYTGGRDYFLYSGAVHHSSNLINLLKAFSVFKKRQQTGMKLFICEKPGSSIRSIAQRLLTYKYRSDVVYLAGIDQNELARISASAYALVYPVYFDDFSSSVMEALHCNVPVLTSSDSAMAEVANDAALYADPSDYNAIAAQLIRLYKDENLRDELIKKGAVFSEQYRWQHTAEQLWQSVHRTTL